MSERTYPRGVVVRVADDPITWGVWVDQDENVGWTTDPDEPIGFYTRWGIAMLHANLATQGERDRLTHLEATA